MNRSEAAFTLIELLLVLSVMVVVSIFTFPALYKTVIKQEQAHFFEQFSSDVFLLQSQSLLSPAYRELTFRPGKYYMNLPGETISRSLPEELEIRTLSPPIVYSMRGTIVQPISYRFTSNDHHYRIVFPFGAARHYVAE